MEGPDTETLGPPRTVRAMVALRPLLHGNKHLQQKWDMDAYELHRRKVKSAKPTIDMTPPKTYSHVTVNLKKLKLEEELAMKMRRENNMLAENIAHIKRTGGGLDNWNYYDRKSLGEERRQLELLRIAKENRRILFRLSHKAKGKAETTGKETRTGTSKNEGARGEMQQDIETCPEPNAPEKHTS